MNILHISAVKNWGGGENHLENLYKEVSENHKEHNQYIICAKNGLFHERLKKGDFNFIPAPLKIKMDLRFSLTIKKVCKSKKIDIIHIHDPTALTLSVIADRIFNNLPVFVFSKKTSFPIKNRKQTLFKYNYKKIKRIICVSNATKEVTLKSIDDKSKVVTIYNGIRFGNKIDKTEFKLRDKYKINKNTTLIGTIGNHIRAKNLLTYIEVVNEIVNVRKITNFHFIQIGMFTDRSEMYFEKVKEYSLENFITFTDFINNASAFLPQFDIFLLTSQSEGLPQVINQAFYHKVPVVSTNVGGIKDIIIDGENGFLTEIEDSKKLADYLIAIQKDDKLIKQFTKKSYKQVVEGFSTVTMAEKTIHLYQEILNSK